MTTRLNILAILDVHFIDRIHLSCSSPLLSMYFSVTLGLSESGTIDTVRVVRVSIEATITQGLLSSLVSHAGFSQCGQPLKLGRCRVNLEGMPLFASSRVSSLWASANRTSTFKLRNFVMISFAQLSTSSAGQTIRVGLLLPFGGTPFSNSQEMKNEIKIVLPIPVWSARKAPWVAMGSEMFLYFSMLSSAALSISPSLDWGKPIRASKAWIRNVSFLLPRDTDPNSFRKRATMPLICHGYQAMGFSKREVGSRPWLSGELSSHPRTIAQRCGPTWRSPDANAAFKR